MKISKFICVILSLLIVLASCSTDSAVDRQEAAVNEANIFITAANAALDSTPPQDIEINPDGTKTYKVNRFEAENGAVITGTITTAEDGRIISINLTDTSINNIPGPSFAMETDENGKVSITIDGETTDNIDSSLIPRKPTQEESDLLSIIGYSISEGTEKAQIELFRTAYDAVLEGIYNPRNFRSGDTIITGKISKTNSTFTVDLSSFSISGEDGTISGQIKMTGYPDDRLGASGTVRFKDYTPIPEEGSSMEDAVIATITEGKCDISTYDLRDAYVRYDIKAEVGSKNHTLIESFVLRDDTLHSETILDGFSLITSETIEPDIPSYIPDSETMKELAASIIEYSLQEAVQTAGYITADCMREYAKRNPPKPSEEQICETDSFQYESTEISGWFTVPEDGVIENPGSTVPMNIDFSISGTEHSPDCRITGTITISSIGMIVDMEISDYEPSNPEGVMSIDTGSIYMNMDEKSFIAEFKADFITYDGIPHTLLYTQEPTLDEDSGEFNEGAVCILDEANVDYVLFGFEDDVPIPGIEIIGR